MGARTRYTTGAIVLHWLIAALVLLNVAAALVAEQMPRAQAMQIMATHKAIGLTVLALSVLRIAWRVTHRAPPFARDLKVWEVVLARTVQTAFYVLIVAIPLTGWLMVSAYGGKPVSWFGVFDVPALPVSGGESADAVLGPVHEWLAFGTLALLVLHVAGALKHQYGNRDGTLTRMLPFLRRA